jgi:hypothetical protein
MFAFSDKDWPGIAKMVEECGELQEVLPLVILAKSLGKMTQTQGKLLDDPRWHGSLVGRPPKGHDRRDGRRLGLDSLRRRA